MCESFMVEGAYPGEWRNGYSLHAEFLNTPYSFIVFSYSQGFTRNIRIQGEVMPTIEDVKQYLSREGIEVWEFQEPTPTSHAAARAVGCSVGEIAKSILFIVGNVPVLVVTCGDLKVKGSLLKKTSKLSGKVRLPEPAEVMEHTGYAPGGVCPFMLPRGLRVFIDSSMRRFPRVHAAAGNDRSAVPITVDQLLAVTGGEEAALCQLGEHSGEDAPGEGQSTRGHGFAE